MIKTLSLLALRIFLMGSHLKQLEDVALKQFGRLLAGNWIKSIEFARSMNLECLHVIAWNA